MSALATMTQPATPAIQPDKRLQIRGKLKAALDGMVWDGLDLASAARNFKMTAFAIRKAMAKPHVQAYLRVEKQVLRESLSPRNIHRLREIRDAANNMPAIHAIRTLEGMGDDQLGNGASGASASPGITIRILNVVQSGHVNERQPVTVDHEPPRAIVSVVD